MLPATRYLAIDLETSGFKSTARVLEVGCVLFENGEPIREWSSLVRPVGINWEEPDVQQAISVNGLKPEMFEGKPTFTEIFSSLFVHLRSARVWVAHNAQFDMRMLDNEFKHLKGENFPLQPQEGWLCTLALSRHLHPGVKGHKLDQVAERWDVRHVVEHRASSDAMTCGRIMGAMSKGDLPNDIGWIHGQRTEK